MCNIFRLFCFPFQIFREIEPFIWEIAVVFEGVLLTFDPRDPSDNRTDNRNAIVPAGRTDSISLDPAEFARVRLGLIADERQCEVLRANAHRLILNCTRQWGKSTIAAARALHRALTVPKSLVLVASPSERQSAEWMRKAKEMATFMDIQPRGDGDNRISLLLPNGSRIVGLPGMDGRIRGYSAVSMMMIDEASQVTDAMYRSLRPMLAVLNGDLWLMSTPWGKRGFFYEAWAHGGDEWMRVQVPATECPRISKEFLEEQRRVMGMEWFRQEHMCEFVDNGMGVFDRDVVEAAVDDGFEPLAD